MAGEVPLAVVKVPKSDKSPLTDVQKCVLTRLGRSYALERVLRLDDLGLEDWPKTTSGKVLKRELQRMTLELIKRETEQMSNGNGHVGKQRTERIRLTERELQEYLLDRVKASGILVDTIDDDFHNAGMDSLLAMQLRNAIVKNISDGIDVPMNIIFEAGNVRDLAARLKAEDSPHDEPVTNVDSMAAMVDRYSNFRAHKAPATRKRKRGVSNNVPETHTIVSHFSNYVTEMTLTISPATHRRHGLARSSRTGTIDQEIRRKSDILPSQRRQPHSAPGECSQRTITARARVRRKGENGGV